MPAGRPRTESLFSQLCESYASNNRAPAKVFVEAGRKLEEHHNAEVRRFKEENRLLTIQRDEARRKQAPLSGDVDAAMQSEIIRLRSALMAAEGVRVSLERSRSGHQAKLNQIRGLIQEGAKKGSEAEKRLALIAAIELTY